MRIILNGYNLHLDSSCSLPDCQQPLRQPRCGVDLRHDGERAVRGARSGTISRLLALTGVNGRLA